MSQGATLPYSLTLGEVVGMPLCLAAELEDSALDFRSPGQQVGLGHRLPQKHSHEPTDPVGASVVMPTTLPFEMLY